LDRIGAANEDAASDEASNASDHGDPVPAVKEKNRGRGKNSSTKRFLRKKRSNVITKEMEAIKAKMAVKRGILAAKRHQVRDSSMGTGGALGRFAR